MNEFQFDCPKCGQNILATASWAGRRMTCPSCETRIIIPAPTVAPKKSRGRPVGTEAPPQTRIRVQLPPRTARSASASAPSRAQGKEAGRRRQ